MAKMQSPFLRTALTVVLCICMLIGTVWTLSACDQGSSEALEIYWTKDPVNGPWHNIQDAAHQTVFNHTGWTIGYTDVRYIKLVNTGKQALDYTLSLPALGDVNEPADVIDVFYALDRDVLSVTADPANMTALGRLKDTAKKGTIKGTLLPASEASLTHASGEVYVTVAMKLSEDAKEAYPGKTAGNFSVAVKAKKSSYREQPPIAAHSANCAHCNKAVVWQPLSVGMLPSGHYFLHDNITANQQFTLDNNANAVLDLNGKTLTFSETAGFDIAAGQRLMVTDSSGSGAVSSATKVFHVRAGGKLELLGGTFSAPAPADVLYATDRNTSVYMADEVTIDGNITLKAESVLHPIDGYSEGAPSDSKGTFTDKNFKGTVDLKIRGLLDLGRMDPGSNNIRVTADGTFTTAMKATKEDPTTIDAYVKCFTVPEGYQAISQSGSALSTGKDLTAQIRQGLQTAGTFAAYTQADQQAIVAANSCPMCGATGITWSDYDPNGSNPGSHIVMRSAGTAQSPLALAEILPSSADVGMTCIMLDWNSQIYTTGTFLIQPHSTLNIMGGGTLISDGTGLPSATARNLGLFSLTGEQSTLNIYGGNYRYTGSSYQEELDGNGKVLSTALSPLGALISVNHIDSTVNIYNATIGNETNEKESYNISAIGTVNMYGGTIRNGRSQNDTAGGNITLHDPGVFNLYEGTVTGGHTCFRGGNILLRSYATLNIGYPGLDLSPEITNGSIQYNEDICNALDLQYQDQNITVSRVPGGANIGTRDTVYYTTINFHSGTITGGKADTKGMPSGYTPYSGGGNIYAFGGVGTRITINGGTITGGDANSGGNVYVRNGCTLTINGGSITGGKATYGGNVSIFNFSRLFITGGTISGGVATARGGNLNVGYESLTTKPHCTITGGTITGGKAGQLGGNISVFNAVLSISNSSVTNGEITGSSNPEAGNIGVSGDDHTESGAEKKPANSELILKDVTIDGHIKVFRSHAQSHLPTVTLAGKVNLSGGDTAGLYLGTDVKLDASGLTDGSRIVIQMEAPAGPFSEPLESPDAFVKYFVSFASDRTVVVNDSNALALKFH